MADKLIETDEGVEKAGSTRSRAKLGQAKLKLSLRSGHPLAPGSTYGTSEARAAYRNKLKGKAERANQRSGIAPDKAAGARAAMYRTGRLSIRPAARDAALAQAAIARRTRTIRKSGAPDAIETLYAEIEKAKPLLARGKDGSRSGVVGGRTIRLERAQGTYGLGTRKSPLKPMTYRLSVENGSTRHGYNMAHKDSRARGKDHLSRLKRGKPLRGE